MSRLKTLLPTLSDWVFLTPVFFIFVRMNGARALLGDGDTGWHIRTGEWILAHHQVPTTDIFSFSRPDGRWFAWEWLTDISMALIHRFGGMQAIVLGALLLISATFLLLYRFVLRRCGSPMIAFAVTAVCAAGSAIHWLARPHLFTLLFTVVFLTLLTELPAGKLWILPVLMLVWTNLHGGFFVGIVLICAWVAGDLIEAVTGIPDKRRPALRRALHYGLLATCCFLVTFANPYTWHLHEHLLAYLSNPAYMGEIAEFLSVDFHHPLAHFYEPMLLLSAVAAYQCFRARRFADVLLILAWSHLSLMAVRNIPLFLIVAAAPVAAMLADWLREAEEKERDSPAASFKTRMYSVLGASGVPAGAIRLNAVSIAALALVAARLYAQSPGANFRTDYDPAAYPKQAMALLQPSDRVFADDEWGDYLIYHANPPRKVFVDGRSDFYGPDFEKSYLDILHVRSGWKKTLDDYQIDTILARVDTALSGALLESGQWQLTHQDPVALIFRRTSSMHASVATEVLLRK